MKLLVLHLCFFTMTSLWAQNLMEERIWRLSPRKKAIFLEAGVFHKSSELTSSNIVGLRNSVVQVEGMREWL